MRDRRAGVSAYYRFDEVSLDPAQRALWLALSTGSDDPLLRQDAERVAAVLAICSRHAAGVPLIAGAIAKSLRKADTWCCLIQVTPLLDLFIDFKAAATGTSSAAVTVG